MSLSRRNSELINAKLKQGVRVGMGDIRRAKLADEVGR